MHHLSPHYNPSPGDKVEGMCFLRRWWNLVFRFLGGTTAATQVSATAWFGWDEEGTEAGTPGLNRDYSPMQTTWHKLFPSFCLYQYRSTSLQLSWSFSCNILELYWFQSAPLCGKCNFNHSWSVTVGICPSLSHHDGLVEVGGGSHTDWECLLAWVCVCCVCQTAGCTVRQTVSQSEDCNAFCGLLYLWQDKRQEADKRVLKRKALSVCVWWGGGWLLRCN